MENGLCPPKLFQFLSLQFDDDCRRTGCELALICSHEQTDGSPISYLSQFARKQIRSPHPTLKFSKFQFCPKYENSKLIPSTNPSIMNLLLPSSSPSSPFFLSKNQSARTIERNITACKREAGEAVTTPRGSLSFIFRPGLSTVRARWRRRRGGRKARRRRRQKRRHLRPAAAAAAKQPVPPRSVFLP